MFDKVTSLIGTSLTTADLYKFMAEADKVRMFCVMMVIYYIFLRMEMEKLTITSLLR